MHTVSVKTKQSDDWVRFEFEELDDAIKFHEYAIFATNVVNMDLTSSYTKEG